MSEGTAQVGAEAGARHAPLLRMEAAVILVAAVWLYGIVEAGWGMFLLLFLVPDVFMLGYLRGRRVGATVYNVGHTYLGPAALALWAGWAASPLGFHLALIWTAHIAFDRVLGFGLKDVSGFRDTHLQRV